jgi:hypothetical protein
MIPKRYKILTTYVALCMVMVPMLSQAQDVPKLIELYFTEVRAGKYPPIPKQLSLAENSKEVLERLVPYATDSVAGVRSNSYTLASLAGNSARQSNQRQLAVQQLIEGASDADGGNAGLALGYLTTFRKEDFTAAAKDKIRNLLARRAAHFEELLRLIGYLELTDVKESIRPYTQLGNSQATRWAAIVSLARMNDGAAAEEMMRRARKLPVNDDVIYKLFPDLVYSRHPDAIAYMVEALKSDDKNCMSADAEREQPIPCGYRIMEQLAPVIADFPLELDKSGDIKTKDYVAALQKTREWFLKHTTYTILRDRF